jgi:hypothetical protein
VELLFNGVSYGMCIPLDVHINAKVKRACQAVDLIPEREYRDEERGRLFGKEES